MRLKGRVPLNRPGRKERVLDAPYWKSKFNNQEVNSKHFTADAQRKN